MRADSWGPEAAARVVSGMTRVTRASEQRSPLEDEVAGLRQTGLDESADGAFCALRDLGPAWRSWFGDLSLILVDATIARDKAALDAADELIREFHRALAVVPEEESGSETVQACRSWAQLTSQHLRNALDRIAPAAAGLRLRGTRRERFLQIVAERPGVKSREIREWFNADETTAAGPGHPRKLMDEGQLSRLGHGLRAEGFVLAERGPHGLSWELTPRGEDVLAQLAGTGRPQGGATRLVVSTGRVPAGELSHLIHDDPPPSIWFLRAHDVVRYRQTRRVSQPVDDTGTEGPHSIDAAIKGLMGEQHAPPSFRVDERLYERVA